MPRVVVHPSADCYDSGMRKGIGVSPGVVIGKAYCIHEIFVNPKTRRLAEDKIFSELRRFELAREHTAADLRPCIRKSPAR